MSVHYKDDRNVDFFLLCPTLIGLPVKLEGRAIKVLGCVDPLYSHGFVSKGEEDDFEKNECMSAIVETMNNRTSPFYYGYVEYPVRSSTIYHGSIIKVDKLPLIVKKRRKYLTFDYSLNLIGNLKIKSTIAKFKTPKIIQIKTIVKN